MSSSSSSTPSYSYSTEHISDVYRLDMVELSRIIFIGVRERRSVCCCCKLATYVPSIQRQKLQFVNVLNVMSCSVILSSYSYILHATPHHTTPQINVVILCAYTSNFLLGFHPSYTGGGSRTIFKMTFASMVFTVMLGIQYYYLLMACIKTIPNGM